MTSPPRTIHLRRPPVLAMQADVFVPQVGPSGLNEVDQRWAAIREANATAFDGRVCHVLGVHRNGHGGATVHAIECAYRFYAVQDDGFDLGVRPLGVKGIVTSGDRILIGRRSAQVARYAGLREFAPGGMVEPGIDPHDSIVRELAEETRLSPAAPPFAIAILYDEVARTWEIIYRIRPSSERLADTAEYESLEWMPINSIGSIGDFSPISRPMVAIARREPGDGRPQATG